MPHIDKKHAYETLQWYPHMGPRDAHIWNSFVLSHPHHFLSAIYDMRCGTVENCPEEYPKNIQDAWRDLCRGRIDVVAETNTTVYVIEVKPSARGEAIGQAINNAFLYKKDNRPEKPVIAAVITDIIIPNTDAVARALDVQLWTP